MVTHGMSHTRIYKLWIGMRVRCQYVGAPNYRFYGARGIAVCERWASFANFYSDMGDPPPGMSLDRIDSARDYSPDNCRWATDAQQARNRSNNRPIELGGITKLLQEWIEQSGIPYYTVRGRIDKLGWSVERALTTPVEYQRRWHGERAPAAIAPLALL